MISLFLIVGVSFFVQGVSDWPFFFEVESTKTRCGVRLGYLIWGSLFSGIWTCCFQILSIGHSTNLKAERD